MINMLNQIILISIEVLAAVFLFWTGAILYKKKENKSIKLWGLGLVLWSFATILEIFSFGDATYNISLYIAMRFILGTAFILMFLRGTLYLLLSEKQTNILTTIYGLIVLTIDFTINLPRDSLQDNIAIHAIYVTMPLSIVLFSYFYTYYLKLKSRNILALSLAWGFFFITKMMHILANSLRITFLETIFMTAGSVLGIAIAFAFIYVRKVEKTWREITRPKSYVIDRNFLEFMNREFQTDTKGMIAEELNKNNITSIYELGPKQIDKFLDNLLASNFPNVDPRKKGYVKTKIIDMLGLKLPPIFEAEEEDNAYHVKTLEEFFTNFDKIGTDPEKIISSLSKVNFDSVSKEELINITKFFANNGIPEQEQNLILESLQNITRENKNIETIKSNIQTKKDQGLNDDQIKKYFVDQGNNKEIVDKAFKKFYKDSFYTTYLPNIVEHMKNFVFMGKNDNEIVDIFLQHGWPKETLEDALKMTKEQIEKEQSSAILEDTIINRLVPGIKKEYLLKTLSKRVWPEEELTRYNPDLDGVMAKFGEMLDSIKIDPYIMNIIKQSLIEKNWPEDIVNLAINNVTGSIRYHKTLKESKIKAIELADKGNSSVEVRNYLQSQGLDNETIYKVINMINKNLAATNQKEKMRSFNSHIFSTRRKKPSYIDGFMKGFETTNNVSVDELKQKEEKLFDNGTKNE